MDCPSFVLGPEAERLGWEGPGDRGGIISKHHTQSSLKALATVPGAPLPPPALPTKDLERGARVAQLVKRQTCDFDSGHDLSL